MESNSLRRYPGFVVTGMVAAVAIFLWQVARHTGPVNTWVPPIIVGTWVGLLHFLFARRLWIAVLAYVAASVGVFVWWSGPTAIP